MYNCANICEHYHYDKFEKCNDIVSLGFAKYDRQFINPCYYNFYRLYGENMTWRVAIPNNHNYHYVLDRISKYGPSSVGYIRLGDTIMPSYLSSGDRMTLSNTYISFD
jgi:hypothetical protein